MNILMLTAGVPHPTSGANIRNYHLLKALASHHAVTLLALTDDSPKGVDAQTAQIMQLTQRLYIAPTPSHAKRLSQVTGILRGRSYFLSRSYTREVQDILDALFQSDEYHMVLFEGVFLAGYRVPEGIKVIIDQHNIEHELLQRTYAYEKASLRKWYSWLEGQLLKKGEIERCQKADAVLVTSDREHLLLKQLLPQQSIVTIPNGVDLASFQAFHQNEVANRIVFTGTMDYYPNIDAVLTFARLCWPLIQERVPGVTWQIVGRNPPPEVQHLAALPGISVTGSVPAVQPYLATAALAIVPLQIGSGTRLKILEALAMRKAVVSTSVGCEGLTVESGRHLLIADRSEAFAEAVVALLQHPAKRAQLGNEGRSLVEREYTWEQAGDRLLHVLDEVASLPHADSVAPSGV